MQRELGGILSALDLSAPVDAETLCRRFGRRRGRPVEMVARSIPIGSVSGVLISYPTRDVVVHRDDASRHHRDHIVYHEFCHLALGHLGHGATATCGPTGTGTGAPGERESRDREWEAEYGATLLTAWSEAHGPSAPVAPRDARSSHLVTALGGRWA